MIDKHKLYSIALVSTAWVLMLVSIASAATFVENPNHCENCNGQMIKYTFNITNNSGKVNIEEPIKITENKTPCSTPFLKIEKSVDPKTDKFQGQIPTYNYKVTNIGDAPIKGVVVFDNKIVPGILIPGESVQFQTLHPPHLSI